MAKNPLFDEASKVRAIDGTVQIDGPDGVEIALTPDAAIETSNRLLDEATAARGQQIRSADDGKTMAAKRPPK